MTDRYAPAPTVADLRSLDDSPDKRYVEPSYVPVAALDGSPGAFRLVSDTARSSTRRPGAGGRRRT